MQNFFKGKPGKFFYWGFLGLIGLLLTLGFGYFWGRYDQIQLGKSVVETVPDVNCSKQYPFDSG